MQAGRIFSFFVGAGRSGDVVKRDAQGNVSENLYQDDPSNVHHSYLGDQVRFVNMHAGPKETHVFHLHAQQWVQDKDMDNSTVLDSQTISPGSTFSYDILNGGSGNLNHTVGDSIFHCHLYPHFAQGMWELWRSHDTFEDGTRNNYFAKLNSGEVAPCGNFTADKNAQPCGRNLPDKEIESGTLTPALVPLPWIALPPMPSDKFGGYPFYIPAMAGHRPPQPPNDIECNDPGWKPWDAQGNPQACRDENNGGLPRHIIAEGKSVDYLAFRSGKDANEREKYQKEIEAGFLAHPKCSVEDWNLGLCEIKAEFATGKSEDGKTNFCSDEDRRKDKCILKCTPEKRKQGLCDLFDLGISTNTEIADRVSSINTNKNNHFSLARQLKSGKFVFLNPLGDANTHKDFQGWATKAMEREQIAMKFHANRWNPFTQLPVSDDVAPTGTPSTATPKIKGYESVDHAGKTESERVVKAMNSGKAARREIIKKEFEKNIFAVNGRDPMPGAPYADPCPDWVKVGVENDKEEIEPVGKTRTYRGAYVQFDLTVNKYGWHDPQARIAVLEEDVADTISGERPAEPLFFRAKSGECIEFRATNLVPSALNLDDFQIFSATDTIGQHIHLVKFDVTSSDGSANGWNYEDGTLSPDEVRERLHAHNEQAKADNEPGKFLKPKVHPMFSTTKTERHFGSYFNSLRSRNGQPKIESRADCAADNWWTPEAAKKNPWCGAQTTVQRWFADPVFNRENHDRTLRSVFTHDHFGPSSHQQHGLYAALVIEPRESKWQPLNVEYNERDKTKNVNFYGEGKMLRNDGGPTSFAANIIFPDSLTRTEEQAENPEYEQSFREYNLAFADFAIVYTSQNRPVNAPNRVQADLPKAVEHSLIPKPEAISAEDPGTQVLNYRNEPIPLRIAEMKDKSGELMTQKTEPPISDAQIPGTCSYEVTQERVESTDRRRLLAPPRCAKDDATCIKRLCHPGDMANVFSSLAHKVKPENDTLKNYYPTCTAEEQKYGKTCGEPSQKIEEGKGTDKKTIIESARQEGDPATPILSAYANDRVQIRLVQGAQEEQHIFSMHGVKWLSQPGSHGSGFVNGQHIGISEHFEAQINPGTSPVPIDHFYSSSTVDNLWDGMWGLLRVFPANKNLKQTGLARLPGFGPYPVRMPDKDWSYSHPSNPAPRGKVLDIINQRSPSDWTTSALSLSSTFVEDPTNPCDGDDAQKIPLRIFDVHAVPAEKLFGQQLVYNEKFGLADPNAIVFVKNAEYYRTNVTNEYDNLAKRYKEIVESKLKNKNGKKILPLTEQQLDDLAAARNKNNYLQNQGDTELVDDFDRLQKLQQRNNQIEPLILRARAGECIEIRLTNELPSEPKDGPDFPDSWSWNQMPAIVDNFNFNQFKMSNRVSLHPQLVAFKPLFHDGSNVGLNYDSTVAPGETKSYKWYAGDRLLYYEYENGKRKNYTGDYRHTPIEFGAISLTDWGDVIKHSSHGAIGALIIEPEDAQHPGVNSPDPVVQAKYRNPKYLAQEDRVGKFGLTTAASATILTEKKPFREFVVLYQDDVSFQQHGNPVFNLSNEEDSEDTGGKAFNYRTEPLWARMGVGSGASFEELRSVDQSSIFSNWEFGKDGVKPTGKNWNICQDSSRSNSGRCLLCEDGLAPINKKCADGKPAQENKALGYGPPATPMFTATVGDAVRFRIVQPSGHPRQHTFTVYGHSWPEFPWNLGEPHYLNRKEENYYIKGSYKLVDKGRFKPDGQPLNGAVPTGNIIGAVNGIGPMRHFNLLTTAGGKFNVPGQYMYRTIDSFNLSGGLWGIFDVKPKPEKPTEPLAFTTRPNVNARNISKRYSAKRSQ